jgi:LysM repeat protein
VNIMEKAIFPMKYLRVTEGMNDPFSHLGTLRIDFAGKDTGVDNVWAPYTGIIRRISAGLEIGNNVYLESINPVKYADGTEDYMTIQFTHDSDISDLHVGQIVKQGEVFYQEGTAAQSTGNHLQIDISRGKYTGLYQVASGKWVMNNEYDPTKALWIKNDTIVLDSGGYDWKITTTNTVEPTLTKVTYVVKSGDTLISIAAKYNVNWHDLYNANINIIGASASNISVGQVLTIPNVFYYTVVSGDTLTSIAKKNNTTWDKIYNDNKATIGSNPANIKVGQKLIIRY